MPNNLVHSGHRARIPQQGQRFRLPPVHLPILELIPALLHLFPFQRFHLVRQLIIPSTLFLA